MSSSVRSVLLMAMLGCGQKQAPAIADAPPDVAAPDAMTDAGDAGQPNILVTVRSRTRAMVVPGAKVIFSDPSGAMTAEVITDANGQAQATISAGDSLTVDYDDTYFVTIVGIKPGDQLTVGAGRVEPLASLTVSFTAYDPGATYRVYTPCYTYAVTPPATTVTPTFCIGPLANTDVYVVASVNGADVASASVHNVDLTTGAVTIPDAWTPLDSLQVDYTNAPGTFTSDFYDSPEGYQLHGNDPVHATLKVPAGAPLRFITTDVDYPNGFEWVMDHLDPAATSYQLDIAGIHRDHITRVVYEGVTRSVEAFAPSGLTGDLVAYHLAWGSSVYGWDIYAPAIGAQILPVLPPDIPDPTTGSTPTVAVDLFDTSSLTGWDAVRPVLSTLASNQVDPNHVFEHLYVQNYGL